MPNPIRRVDGQAIPRSPSRYQWKLEDVSAADAGRTEDVVMHKKRLGQVKAIELSWQNIPIATASAILQAFQPEYITVEYLDPLVGGYTTDVFYVGNRTAPLYNEQLDVWSNISFSIIKRNG